MVHLQKVKILISQNRRLRRFQTASILLKMSYHVLTSTSSFDLSLKHSSTVGSRNKKSEISRNSVSLRAIHSGETQEPAHIPQEFALQIFSPGVHIEFSTLRCSLFVPGGCTSNNFQQKYNFLFVEQ